MAFFCVMLHHGACRHFLSALAILATRFRLFLDVLVHPLFLVAHAFQVFSAWHCLILLGGKASNLCSGIQQAFFVDALSKTRLAGSPATRSPALPADVKFRAERKLGGRAEALPHDVLRSVFIVFGGPLWAMEHSLPVAAL
jgi:hypothetical protein